MHAFCSPRPDSGSHLARVLLQMAHIVEFPSDIRNIPDKEKNTAADALARVDAIALEIVRDLYYSSMTCAKLQDPGLTALQNFPESLIILPVPLPMCSTDLTCEILIGAPKS